VIHVLWNVYNEASNLPRAVSAAERALAPKEVRHVFIDGRYPDYPAGRGDFSSDGTREIAEVVGTLLEVADYECEKRTAGLRHIDTVAEDGDFVLVLDADEELTSVFGWPDRVGSFMFTRASRPEVTYGRCRLYRWEPGLEFKHRHYDLYSSDGVLVSSLEDAPDFQLIGHGIHHNDSHGPERTKVKEAYYRELRERESSPWEVSV
jgi:hypothetical protein